MRAMQILPTEQRVLDAALELASTLGADPQHSVAAAAMDTHGRVHTGVNVYHFTGGPCAELVALGAAATQHAGPLVTIAAAGDGGRGLIAPCGRCRQVLIDTHPDIMIFVPGDDGPELRPVRDLLPATYLFPDAAPPRVVRFNRRYYDAVASGEKTTTIRYDDPVAIGPATLYFEGDEAHRTLPGMITDLRPLALGELTDEQAVREGAASADSLRAGLRGHYPDLPDDAVVTVVTFRADHQA